VLLPLLDLDPDMVHPESGERLDRCTAAIDAAGVRRLGDAARVLGGMSDNSESREQ
jgi:hypothetical protein